MVLQLLLLVYTKLLEASKTFGRDAVEAKVELLKFGRDVFKTKAKEDRAYMLIGDICSKLAKAELIAGPPKVEEAEYTFPSGEKIKKAFGKQGFIVKELDDKTIYTKFSGLREIRSRVSLPQSTLLIVFVNFENLDSGALVLENPGDEYPDNRKFYTGDLDTEDEVKIRQIMTEAGFQEKQYLIERLLKPTV